MSYVLGIDGGGTSTVCVLADEWGRIVARTETSASNHRKSDLSEAREAILTGIRAVAREAGIDGDRSPVRLAAACAGLAGVDTESDATTLRAMLAEMVETDHLQVVNDGEIALAGALENEPGVLVISGTGSIAWAASADGQRVRVGGWDYILSDEGSGYDIGTRVLRAVAAAHDRRIAPTYLTEAVFREFGVCDFHDLLDFIYHKEITPQRISSLAPLADAAAEAGDEAALYVLEKAAAELAGLAASAARLAGLDGHDFPLVAMGGVLLADGYFARRFHRAAERAVPNACFIAPLHPPAEGAVHLALRSLGVRSRVKNYV